MKKLSWVCKPFAVWVAFTAGFIGAGAPAWAQWQPVVKTSVKTVAKKVPSAARAASLQAGVQKAAPAVAKKTMSETNKRLYYSLMTKAGISQKKALQYLYKHGAQPTRYPAPALSQERILFHIFPSFASGTKDLPVYPFSNPKRVFYRGISVNEEGLRNILQNGLRAKDSGSHHSDFSIFTYQTPALVDMANQAVGDTKNICLISDAQRACAYAVRRAQADGKTPIVIQVKNTIAHQANPVGAGVLSQEDIPVSQIVRISALLPVNGTPVWGDISMTPTGDFIFTPYETR